MNLMNEDYGLTHAHAAERGSTSGHDGPRVDDVLAFASNQRQSTIGWINTLGRLLHEVLAEGSDQISVLAVEAWLCDVALDHVVLGKSLMGLRERVRAARTSSLRAQLMSVNDVKRAHDAMVREVEMRWAESGQVHDSTEVFILIPEAASSDGSRQLRLSVM